MSLQGRSSSPMSKATQSSQISPGTQHSPGSRALHGLQASRRATPAASKAALSQSALAPAGPGGNGTSIQSQTGWPESHKGLHEAPSAARLGRLGGGKLGTSPRCPPCQAPRVATTAAHNTAHHPAPARPAACIVVPPAPMLGPPPSSPRSTEGQGQRPSPGPLPTCHTSPRRSRSSAPPPHAGSSGPACAACSDAPVRPGGRGQALASKPACFALPPASNASGPAHACATHNPSTSTPTHFAKLHGRHTGDHELAEASHRN